MLEATVVLQLVLGKWVEGAIVFAVLVLNGMIAFAQEGRAQSAADLLRRRLAVRARVLRDGTWGEVAAAELVPGDIIHVRMGDLVPADIRLVDGHLLLDQSALTGESVAVEAQPESTAYSGTTVVHGEATGEVTGTGTRTFFGRTAELVSTAGARPHLEGVVFRVVRAFIALDVVLAVAGTAYLASRHAPFADVVSFAVVLLLASVPVAMPAAFTLAGAMGSQHLSGRGVLTARLSAIQDAAAMDVLCVDKTGTITANRLELAALVARPPTEELELLRLAAEASDEATQDPIDLAILRAARSREGALPLRQREMFVPFEPATKRSEAVIRDGETRIRVVKGAPQVIAQLTGEPSVVASRDSPDLDRLAGAGMRVLAVAAGADDGPLREAGLVGLADPARPDAPELVRTVQRLGIRVVMVTGDTLATGRAVAKFVGIPGAAAPASAIRSDQDLTGVGVFAEVLPEDKLRLVTALQRAGHVVGMTGDGVNDAPALRQAEVGIAVATATDVAKSAAAAVLTTEGLGGIVSLVEESRRIHQRSLTYALNVSIKKIEVPVLLTAGVLAWGEFLFTPLLMALLLVSNDLVSMAIATDHVSFSPRPDRWDMRALLAAATIVALPLLAVSGGILWVARDVWPRLDQDHLRTLVFLTLVLSSQATIYLVRERSHSWRAAPTAWLVGASAAAIGTALAIALIGGPVASLSPAVVGATAAAVLVASLVIDLGKVRAFRAVGLSSG
jgi:H+-transporting ATPase